DMETFIPDSLFYTNSDTGECAISGMAPPVMTGTHDQCGGMYTITWMYSDSCGNTVEHTQNIAVEPAPEPVFENVPDDMTISCSEADTIAFADLHYSNGTTGLCLIEGDIAPVVEENYNSCGGTITATWTFTDLGGRTIQHVQTISVEPPTEPAFISPPADLTLSCNVLDTFTFVVLD